MNERLEQATTLSLAVLGGLQGAFRYYVRPMLVNPLKFEEGAEIKRSGANIVIFDSEDNHDRQKTS